MKKITLISLALSVILVGCKSPGVWVDDSGKVDGNRLVEDVENNENIKDKNDNNVEIIDTKEEVGGEKLKVLNEYGDYWTSHYGNNFNNYTLKSSNKGMYITGEGREIVGVKLGDSMSIVRNKLGEPLKHIQKGNNLYDVQSTDNLMYEVSGNYITLFFDKHDMYKLRSALVIPVEVENKKDGYYGNRSSELMVGFEDLMVEIINDTRVKHGLNELIYDDNLNEVARQHSRDMIINNFFSHSGSDGSSVKDRIERFGYSKSMYGENIAYGQYGSIHAHEDLMNSLGHRENILNKDFTHVSVGVEVDDNNVPFYTINYYREW